MDMTPEDNMDGPNVYAIVHYNIAVELEHLKRRQEALESYQKALKYVDPSSMLAPAIQEAISNLTDPPVVPQTPQEASRPRSRVSSSRANPQDGAVTSRQIIMRTHNLSQIDGETS